MRIAHVASELAPWCGTGGLGEVMASLPATQARMGHRVAVFCPCYRQTRRTLAQRGRALATEGLVSVELDGRVLHGRVLELPSEQGPRILFLDCPELFDRDPLYDGPDGRLYADTPLRFGWFAAAVLQVVDRVLGGRPDVLHAHDWQAALLPLIQKARPDLCPSEVASVITIHNLSYQGIVPKEWLDRLGLPRHLFHIDGLEFWDRLNLLKGGVALADVTTTVSPRYAREITTLPFGFGLHDFLRQVPSRLVGVLNGLDLAAWDPSADAAIAARYSAADPEGKGACRRALLDEVGLEAGHDEPLVAVVSRFDHHKGLDLVADLVPDLGELGVRMVVLGSGDAGMEQRFRLQAERFGDRLAVRIGWDPALARRIFAGADVFAMPSRMEPCGLAQMQAMRYGTVPVVHAIGGLADTVHDPGDEALARGEGCGFRFEWPDLVGLRWALGRAARMFREDPGGWRRIMRSGMTADFSWHRSAARYLELYREALR
jgi:starch synthase